MFQNLRREVPVTCLLWEMWKLWQKHNVLFVKSCEWTITLILRGGNTSQAVIDQFAISLTKSARQAHLSKMTSSYIRNLSKLKRREQKQRCSFFMLLQPKQTARDTHKIPNKDLFPQQDCYCRLNLSPATPTVHPLTKHTSWAKANTQGIGFWVSALHQLTPVSCRQQVGWVSPSSSSGLSPTCFPSLSPRHTGSAVRSAEGGGGWLAGSSHFKSKHTGMGPGMCTPHSHMYPFTHASKDTSVVCAHANAHTNTHMHAYCPPPFFLLCSCFTLQSCEIQTQCTPGI